MNEDGNLSIKMEQKSESTDQNEKAHYLRREFSYSKYEQTLLLPEDVNREAIAARVNDGVLTVDLPKVQKEEQKAVPFDTSRLSLHHSTKRFRLANG